MRNHKEDTPALWAGATRVADDIYYRFVEGAATPTIWHWCTKLERWISQPAVNHTVMSREPLDLSPSLYWPDCCGLHGFVHDGVWQGA